MKNLLYRLAALATVLAAAGCATTGQPAAPTACPGWTATDYAKGPVLRVIRVYTDPRTRDSAVEIKPMPPKATPLPMTNATLYQYNFGPGSKTQIVVGPPNLKIPLKPAPYRESFLLLQGGVTMELGDGSKFEQGPGDMLVFEDTDAIKGHGAVTGPCGFVSMNIVP